MEIREATVLDLEQLFTLEEECFEHPFKKEDILRELSENPVAKYFVGVEGDELVGFVNFWITFDSATINQICVTKSRRKCGFGGVLMNYALKIAKDNECEFMTLEVRKSNTAAIALYEKCGFTLVTTKPQYYENGEDALYYVKGLIWYGQASYYFRNWK